MLSLLTPAQMYALEARHFAAGVSSLDAMERAAQVFVEELARRCGTLQGKRVAIACGSGNNAGDGYAIARLLHQLGAQVFLCPACPMDALRGDALINAQRAARELSIPCCSPASLERPDVWVDALFGIGLNRPMSDLYFPFLDRMEQDRLAGSVVGSVDVPSGLNAESGRIEGRSVRATFTVAFEYPKTGHYLLDGMDATGQLIVRSIGLTRFLPESPALLVEPSDPACAFPPRKHNSHKGMYGRLLIVAGSFGMAGAAAYAAESALRSGAGLVTIACPRSVVPILQTILPDAMCIPLPEQDGAIAAEAYPVLQSALKGKDAVVVGPGLSTHADPCAVRAVLESDLPAVLDADALNLIALNPALRQMLRPNHVVTPHAGEAFRLCPDCTGMPLDDITRLKRLNAVCLLKGAASIIAGQRVHVSASGSPGMAVGGSGDVLSGILGALLAAGVEPEQAAWCASELHGRCGELAEQRISPVSMNARDLIVELPAAIQELMRT